MKTIEEVRDCAHTAEGSSGKKRENPTGGGKMKTINIYSFEELSEEKQQEAVSKYRDINTEGQTHWHEYIFDNWREELEGLGYLNAEIFYSGFYNQGDGASFEATPDAEKLIERSSLSQEQKAVLVAAYNSGTLQVLLRRLSSRYSHENTVTAIVYGCNHEGAALQEELEEERKNLCREIYAELRLEYEYLCSDTAVAETLVANEFFFDENLNIHH